MKMYILVKNSIPLGIATAAIGHAALGTYLQFSNDPDMIDWKNNSFKKVICEVTPDQFENAKSLDKICIFTESTISGDNETCIGLCPRQDWPECVSKLPLYGREYQKYEAGDLCVVNSRNDLMMDKSKSAFIGNVCVIQKVTKSGLIQVSLFGQNEKVISVPKTNISLKYPV